VTFPTLEDFPAELGEPWHGSLAGYNRHGCRCDACSEASRVYRAQRKATPEKPPDICECGRVLPHKGRCGPAPVPKRMPFNF
jgi:hypothetical protein